MLPMTWLFKVFIITASKVGGGNQKRKTKNKLPKKDISLETDLTNKRFPEWLGQLLIPHRTLFSLSCYLPSVPQLSCSLNNWKPSQVFKKIVPSPKLLHVYKAVMQWSKGSMVSLLLLLANYGTMGLTYVLSCTFFKFLSQIGSFRRS